MLEKWPFIFWRSCVLEKGSSILHVHVVLQKQNMLVVQEHLSVTIFIRSIVLWRPEIGPMQTCEQMMNIAFNVLWHKCM